MLSSGRHLTKEERFFNDQCGFKPGALYVFSEEVEGRSTFDGTLVLVKFREAIFLYSRDSGKILGRDHLFMPSSGQRIAIVPLVFGQASELPRQIKSFRKLKWLERFKLILARRHFGGTLHRGEMYEWPKPLVVVTYTKYLTQNPTTKKMDFLPRQVRFVRAVFQGFLLELDQSLFEVEVLGDDGETVIGRDKVAIRITKDNLPKRSR